VRRGLTPQILVPKTASLCKNKDCFTACFPIQVPGVNCTKKKIVSIAEILLKIVHCGSFVLCRCHWKR